jgi:transposase
MRAKPSSPKTPCAQVVKDIRQATRKHYSAEDRIGIVLDGLRDEDSIAELCRREGIAQSIYYGWPKEFLEAFSRYIIAWKLCTTMKVEDVTATLELALEASPTRRVRRGPSAS